MMMNVKKRHSNQIMWYSIANWTALVSGVFTLVVSVLLMANFIAWQSGVPENERFYSQDLVEKKALLSQDPNNEQIKTDIRELDLQLRQDFFQRLYFSAYGKYLLLGGLTVLILSLKRLHANQKKPGKPNSNSKDPAFEAVNRKQARIAVIVFGGIVIVGMASFSLPQTTDIPLPSSESAASGEEASSQLAAFPSREELEKNWPRFRGAYGLGISNHERIPTSWNEESGEGIVWKTEIALPGNNSPIVWGDRVFIAGGEETQKEVYCYSLANGELLWKNKVDNIPKNTDEEPMIFEDTGYAPSTMACDGSRVYAIFPNGDLICFDFDGNRVWAKNLGIPDNPYGYATSLAMYQHLLLVQYDQGREDDEASVLYAFDGKTGNTVWQMRRPVASSWTTPILIDTGQGEQLITCSDPWVISYEPATGKELWKAELLGTDLAPSPTFENNMVIVLKPNEILYAIRPDGQGNVTETHVVYEKDCPAPDICSPVAKDGLIFLAGSSGDLGCYDATDGELVWEHFFDDFFMASPTIVGDFIYLFGDQGNAYRVKVAREFEVSEPSKLNDTIVATPAFVDGYIVVRGEQNLYCLGTK